VTDLWLQSGDLSFNKGDIIVVIKKTNSLDDWYVLSSISAAFNSILVTAGGRVK
jgi:hypothetical protein